MPSAKVAITLDQQLLKLVDGWVAQGRYANRSQAIQAARRNLTTFPGKQYSSPVYRGTD